MNALLRNSKTPSCLMNSLMHFVKLWHTNILLWSRKMKVPALSSLNDVFGNVYYPMEFSNPSVDEEINLSSEETEWVVSFRDQTILDPVHTKANVCLGVKAPSIFYSLGRENSLWPACSAFTNTIYSLATLSIVSSFENRQIRIWHRNNQRTVDKFVFPIKGFQPWKLP